MRRREVSFFGLGSLGCRVTALVEIGPREAGGAKRAGEARDIKADCIEGAKGITSRGEGRHRYAAALEYASRGNDQRAAERASVCDRCRKGSARACTVIAGGDRPGWPAIEGFFGSGSS